MSINNSSRDFIKEIKRNGNDFYIIHYSCGSLYDDSDNENLSPRITSISVKNYSSGKVASYSTHAIAEELGISRDDVVDRFDEIEKKLLDDFYSFVRDRLGKYWIHWNMRSLTYGFEHIQHRYYALNKKNPPEISDERRINLNDILEDRYGSGYAEHKKMPSLMKMNGGLHRDFLEGEEEVNAFKRKEYINMHNSTLCKVGFFYDVIKKMIEGKLKTAPIESIQPTKLKRISTWFNRIFESRFKKVLGFIIVACGFIAAIITIGGFISQ